jgi:hypothetical protein
VLLLFGLVLITAGVLTAGSHLGEWQKRARLLALPASTIAAAPGSGPVEVRGRVVAGEEGLVRSPISGEEGAYYRVTVEQGRSSRGGAYWTKLLVEDGGGPFYLDDGSGQLARVKLDGASIVIERTVTNVSGPFSGAGPAVEAFLRERGESSRGLFGFNRDLRVVEEIIRVGDSIGALGPSLREPGPPTNDHYRTAATTRLVLAHEGDGPRALIVTTRSKPELFDSMWADLVGAAAVILTGVALVLSALFWR